MSFVLITVIIGVLLFSSPSRAFGRTLTCHTGPACMGTSGNDVMIGEGVGNGVITMNGLGGDDVIYGSNINDVINGGDGNDKIYRNDGTLDDLDGGTGNDKIDGGFGVDNIQGGEGNDFITGGFGNDEIIGGYGADKIYGGYGNDLILPNHEYEQDFAKDTIDCGSDLFDKTELRSSEGDVAKTNCESIYNQDG